jgi:Ca2+-binding RTX toxin-like protein
VSARSRKKNQVIFGQALKKREVNGQDLISTLNNRNIFTMATTPTAGNDTLFGTNGNDTINGLAGNDFFIGSRGSDKLNGGLAIGTDRINYAPLAVNLTYFVGGPQIQVVKAGIGTDNLQNIDIVNGAAQTDNTINASAITSNTGAIIDLSLKTAFIGGIGGFDYSNFDNAIGSKNADTITGNEENNTLQGGDGNDLFLLLGNNDGNDRIDGGNGSDTADYSAAQSAITLASQGLVTGASTGSDILVKIDQIIGANGADNVIDASVGTGISINADLSTQSLSVAGVAGVGPFRVENFVNVVGSSGDDRIKGTSDSNQLAGGAGRDTLLGGGGNDRLDGGSDIDVADFSGETTRTILLPTGVVRQVSTPATGSTFVSQTQLVNIETVIASTLNSAVINASSAGSGITINANLAAQTLRINGVPTITQPFEIQNFDNIVGSRGNDTLTGDGGQNSLDGELGNDLISGGREADNLRGNEGNDTIAGGLANDRLLGGTGNDSLTGDAGNDQLTGANVFSRGVSERDTLIGGVGADQYVLGDGIGLYYLDRLGGFTDGFAEITGFDSSDRLDFGSTPAANYARRSILVGGAVVGEEYFVSQGTTNDIIAKVFFANSSLS